MTEDQKPPAPPSVTVTQADRDAVFAWQNASSHAPNKLAEAFARHRTTAEAASAARVAELEEALDKAATRFNHCAVMIAQGFNIGGTLRAEHAEKALAYEWEARALLAKHQQGEG